MFNQTYQKYIPRHSLSRNLLPRRKNAFREPNELLGFPLLISKSQILAPKIPPNPSMNAAITRRSPDLLPKPAVFMTPFCPFRNKSIGTGGFGSLSPSLQHLSKGGSWDILSFGSIKPTQSLVERVLVDLKEPMDAKKAKTFFHWASQFRQLQHGKSYCVILHILVRAGLLIDSRELLESAIRKKSEAGNPSCLIVEMLLSIHEAVLPGPQAFDLFAQAYSKMRMVELAFDACRCLGDHGFNPNLMSVNTLLHVAQKSNENELARKAFEYMIERIVYLDQTKARP